MGSVTKTSGAANMIVANVSGSGTTCAAGAATAGRTGGGSTAARSALGARAGTAAPFAAATAATVAVARAILFLFFYINRDADVVWIVRISGCEPISGREEVGKRLAGCL